MSNFIDDFREKIAGYFLKREIKKQPHKASIHNLQTAESAGILFDATQPENLKIVKELIGELKEFNIQSKALGYINQSKRDDDYIGDNIYSFVCKKDFSLFYKPKSENITQFMETPFHLLIVLANEFLFPIDYIGSLSKAQFKAGRTNIDNEMFDFMIELKEGDSIKDLKKHIIHYLSIINNKNTQC
ncbi:DUF6913 domain-containing protein [Carboxylicivirga linearis]|uniref:Uncharacterized protein n=1 Tax=Carboxylicivirga linearis TaxID=1628157 RepID=A0ABS5K182_9BACT|nr:hypothetical protein [Carboxylicivirga linearis]MBS2100456.1 hypothetical protein [Carboxylicivirga linearis]